MNIFTPETFKIKSKTEDNKSVFWTLPIRNHFSFQPDKSIRVNAEYKEDELTLPVSCVSEGSKIKVTVTSGDQYIVYEDWKIDEVDRSKNGFEEYKVTYESDRADKCKWHENSIVEVEITNSSVDNCEPFVLKFKVKKMPSWYNDWYKSVEFEQVY